MKTRANTEWVEKTWRDWTVYRVSKLSKEEMDSGYELRSEFTTMSVPACYELLARKVCVGSKGKKR